MICLNFVLSQSCFIKPNYYNYPFSPPHRHPPTLSSLPLCTAPADVIVLGRGVGSGVGQLLNI